MIVDNSIYVDYNRCIYSIRVSDDLDKWYKTIDTTWPVQDEDYPLSSGSIEEFALYSWCQKFCVLDILNDDNLQGKVPWSDD